MFSRPTVFIAEPTPAQFTHTWMAPNFSLVASMAACTEASSVTSVCTKAAFSPSSAATSGPFFSSRSRIITLPPLAMIASAVA